MIGNQKSSAEGTALPDDIKKQTETVTIIQDKTANPAPLGLLGFGMTTVLLNLKNAGLIEMSSMILAMGIFYGGIAQIIAGIMEWKKANTFGTTAFTSYGFFWLTLVGLIVFPSFGWGAAASKSSMAAYLFMWGLFTTVMFVGTLRANCALQFVFASLSVLFFLLAAGDAADNAGITKFAGYEGILCGFSAIYAGLAQVLNEMYGRTVLPIGAPKT
jgi:succinate-acetate transporter protein